MILKATTKPAATDISVKKTGKQTDQLLWDEFRLGGESAYALIYKSHFFSLYSYGLKLCPEKEIVKDVIQDLFVYLWKNKEKLGPTDGIKYYLFTALKRRLIDDFTAQSKFNHLEGIKEGKLLDLMACEENNLIREQLHLDQQQQVERALNKLTLRQKEAVILKFYDNMPNAVIAGKMGISVEGVYNLISKSISRFRKNFSRVCY